jgi:hypothetical protein
MKLIDKLSEDYYSINTGHKMWGVPPGEDELKAAFRAGFQLCKELMMAKEPLYAGQEVHAFKIMVLQHLGDEDVE